jgi:uncharacterized protein
MSSVLVERLRVAAVKGLPQEEVESLELVADGIVEDRRFVLVDDTDRVLYSTYLDSLAATKASWRTGDGAGTLTLAFGDEHVVSARVELGADVAARAYADRPVRGRVVIGPFADALSAAAGVPLRLLHVGVGQGGPGAITVLGDGSVARLATELGLSELDPRRFRMSIELAGLDPHQEDSWTGSLGQIGDAVIRIGGQVPRCVLVTRDPDTRERDHDTLRALLAYRKPMSAGEAPFGVYATVETPGRIHVGDRFEVLT